MNRASLYQFVSAIQSHLPPQLVSQQQVEDMKAALNQVPLVDFLGFECNLTHSTPPDVQIAAFSPDKNVSVLREWVAKQERHPSWLPIDRLLTRWADSALPSISQLWMEFDYPARGIQEPPGIFVGLKDAAGSGGQLLNDADQIITILSHGHVNEGWIAAKDAVAGLPADAQLTHVAMKPHRKNERIRLVVEGLGNTALQKWLIAAGATDANIICNITDELNGLNAKVRHAVAFDEAGLAPRIGLEIFAPSGANHAPTWKAITDWIVSKGWSSENLVTAWNDWPGVTLPGDGGPWPAEWWRQSLSSQELRSEHCRRKLSHIKVAFSGPRFVDAKAYFSCERVFEVLTGLGAPSGNQQLTPNLPPHKKTQVLVDYITQSQNSDDFRRKIATLEAIGSLSALVPLFENSSRKIELSDLNLALIYRSKLLSAWSTINID